MLRGVRRGRTKAARALGGWGAYYWGMTRFNLPVFKGVPVVQTAQGLIHRTLNAQASIDGTIGETVTLDFGLAIVAPDVPRVWMANRLADVSFREGEDVEAAWGQVEALYAARQATCYKWTLAAGNERGEAKEFLAERGWVRMVRRFYHLQQINQMPVRSDLTLIPLRASFEKLGELEMANFIAAGFGEEEDRRQMLEAAVRRLDDPHLDGFLALEGTEAVGRIQLFTDGDLGYIADLDIHPGHRRKGVGATLLMQAFDLAARSRHRYVTLYTDEDNAGAIGLYERIGFVNIGTADTYRRPG